MAASDFLSEQQTVQPLNNTSATTTKTTSSLPSKDDLDASVEDEMTQLEAQVTKLKKE